jgi:hypothetical protein
MDDCLAGGLIGLEVGFRFILVIASLDFAQFFVPAEKKSSLT